jgi:hypothetical protein
MERMVADMKRLDDLIIYNRCWRQAFELVSQKMNTERWVENLRQFYRHNYTFP